MKIGRLKRLLIVEPVVDPVPRERPPADAQPKRLVQTGARREQRAG
jgi:hypothetical protein